MIVDPYKLHPVAPQVALLTREGLAVSEHGELLDLDAWPQGYRLWASYETVYALVREGRGEALCWNNEEIRWRHRRFEDGWQRRASDANVVKLPFDQLPVAAQLKAFAAWRDWLAEYGAAPTGTSGSAAWSLLRARLERRLVTSKGQWPPIRQTSGGRQALGPGGQGRYEGALVHLDLPAAYASTLAGLRYGGVWLTSQDSPGRRLERYAGGDYPVFVRARVRVPELAYGPLLKRPRFLVRGYMESELLGAVYPTRTRVQGVWTWEELEAAEAHGCTIERVLGGWIHRSGWFPFAPWWEAIAAGRSQPGLAGQLAKVTGNALWGRFCMDPRVSGKRSVRSSRGAKLEDRVLPVRGAPWPAHDLAETVSGRVRARLYGVMAAAGDSLLAAHTDGAWLLKDPAEDVNGGLAFLSPSKGNPLTPRGSFSSGPAFSAWRKKEEARRLDLLNPQVLRYWPEPPLPSEPWTVFAGVPAERAAVMFERAWRKAGYAA